jgi:hypothetical protein
MRSEKISDQGINGYNGSIFVASLLPRRWHQGVTARLFFEPGTLVIKKHLHMTGYFFFFLVLMILLVRRFSYPIDLVILGMLIQSILVAIKQRTLVLAITSLILMR